MCSPESTYNQSKHSIFLYEIYETLMILPPKEFYRRNQYPFDLKSKVGIKKPKQISYSYALKLPIDQSSVPRRTW